MYKTIYRSIDKQHCLKESFVLEPFREKLKIEKLQAYFSIVYEKEMHFLLGKKPSPISCVCFNMFNLLLVYKCILRKHFTNEAMNYLEIYYEQAT